MSKLKAKYPGIELMRWVREFNNNAIRKSETLTGKNIMDTCSEQWLNLEAEEMPAFGEDENYKPPSFEFFELGWQKALEQVLKVCADCEEDWDHSISDEVKNTKLLFSTTT